MNRFRYSVLALMGVVLLLALALGALRSASQLWASLAFSVMLGVLLIAVVGIIFEKSDMRKFWTGFALFGWSYALLAFVPWLRGNIQPGLPTTRLLTWVHQSIARPVAPIVRAGSSTICGWLKSDHTIWIEGQTFQDQRSALDHLQRLKQDTERTTVVFYTDGPTAAAQHSASRFDEIVSLNEACRAIGIPVDGNPHTSLTPDWTNFAHVGHSLFALLLALVAGVFVQFSFARMADKQPLPGHRESKTVQTSELIER